MVFVLAVHPHSRAVTPAQCLARNRCDVEFRPYLNLLLATLLLVLTGCGEEPQIRTYKAPRPAKAQSQDGDARMLAAMINRPDYSWFFRLDGPSEKVAEHVDAFADIVASIEFNEQGGADWELPEGWDEQPGTGLRYATILTGRKDPLEIRVTRLEANEGIADPLANVNRWRRQLGLRAIDAAELKEETETISLTDGDAMLFDFEGTQSSGGMQPPFAGGMTPPRSTPRPPVSQPASNPGFSANAPEEWQQGELNPTRKASYLIEDDGKQAEVTVTRFPASAPLIGDLLANVNRWRGELGLDRLSEEQLEEKTEIEAFSIGELEGDRVKIVAPEDGEPGAATLVVMVEQGGQIWFFKLRGDPVVVDRETERFEAYVRSVEFSK